MPPASFDLYAIFAYKRQAFLFRRQAEEIEFPGSFVRCGLPFMRIVAGYLKPTTVFLQRFGGLATKNILSMEKEQVYEFCNKGQIDLNQSALGSAPINPPGYVIIKTSGHILGAGLLMEDFRLLCRFPKAMRQAFARLTFQ